MKNPPPSPQDVTPGIEKVDFYADQSMRLMRIAIKFRWLMVLALLPIFWSLARGAKAPEPVSLEELDQTADIIFKGTVVSSRTVDHGGLTYCAQGGDLTRDTGFKIASIIKGEVPGNTLIFRHCDLDPEHPAVLYNGRQSYQFESGKTYIVFAKKSETAGVFQQLWMWARGGGYAGVLLCTKHKPVVASTIRDIFWSELMAMLKSTDDTDVTYAISLLDGMSVKPGGWGGWDIVPAPEFDRKDVLAALRGLLTNPDSKIAQAAISVIGSHNPYMRNEPDRTRFWLAAVSGQGSPMNTKGENIGGKLYWKDLVTVANSKSYDATRALAILALGRVREPALEQHFKRWLADAAPAVRASATVLLADFPNLATHERLTVLAGDVAPEVRTAAAREIGFAQQVALSDILAKLINDPDAEVRDTAAMSLLSFSPKNEAIAPIFRANLDNEEFGPSFLNALAGNNPQAYLDALANAVEQKKNLQSWHILFKYLQAQPVDQITSGKFDRYLDAMEKTDRQSTWIPVSMYAFYVERGMTDRAKRFRLEAGKAAKFDLEPDFKRVDETLSRTK